MYEKEQKGPVTAIADINGLLITAIGQKVLSVSTWSESCDKDS